MIGRAQEAFRGHAVGVTHVGRVREENQDAYYVDEGKGVFAVMDGAGGMNGGAIASGLVKQSLTTITQPRSAEDLLEQFESRVIVAKDRIENAAEKAGGGAMGTTIAALLTYGTNFACVWAGDSRVYRLRNGHLEQLTTDHTEAQELIDQNVLTAEEARSFARRHVITRAIGSGLELELEMVSGNLRPGDRFLLCSDGLTGHLDDTVIGTFLMNGAQNATAQSLLNGALDGGGTDNVTVVLVDIDRVSAGEGEASR
ncbi:PP2C family protein-serine/threonine phosphatase [Roseibium salinum]|uniref:Protein phosphatase 2C domain-containing protein n=1 Tax=Roseibium salinum TaxID=1604349 RepID=A0ABT3R127_9HYPH|nr:protein phosphatase 2C domain-containing protein [Roseibium sp. DSM 29163]MCX2722923.1 protein phosphatase 2C domain-containing protein [Roseibium sp. DSM 29163]MDN3719148.1 protein phosphatase 2C domain-containing protein [Roseibium salinum]